MKTLQYFSFVVVFVIVNSHLIEHLDNGEEVVLEAIRGVLQDYFAPNEPKVDLLYYGPNSEVLAGKLLQKLPSGISIKVIQLDVKSNAQIESPSILFFDSCEHYFEVLQKITWWSTSRVSHNKLVYAPKKKGLDTIPHLSDANFAIENQNFIQIVNETTVDLVTSFTFSPKACHVAQYKTINRFSSDTMKWHNESFFPEKHQNFYGCNLTVGFSRETTSVMSQEIITTLAQQLNFVIVVVNYSIAPIFEEKLDLVDYVAVQDIQVSKFFEFSSVLFNDYLTFSVPAGEPYTQLEKMFLMFDKATWVWIGVTLAAAFLVILIINFMSIHVKNFVFGRGIDTPTLNTVDIFLNGGQHRVPTRNFARYMLMMFVIWSLIIRTCYQSILYENLQRDMRKPRIQSIDELNEQGFRLVCENIVDHLFNSSSSRIKLRLNLTEMPTETALAEHTNKLTTLILRKNGKAATARLTNTATSLHFLDENTVTAYFSLLFFPYKPKNKVFIKMIDQLITNGVVGKLEEHRNHVKPPEREEEKAQQLTMNHLGACFIAITICLGICCIVFLVECLSAFFVKVLLRLQ